MSGKLDEIVEKFKDQARFFLNLSESVQPVFGNRVELRTKKPAELVTDAQNSVQTKNTVFTVF